VVGNGVGELFPFLDVVVVPVVVVVIEFFGVGADDVELDVGDLQ
jgi:hypothetical protein